MFGILSMIPSGKQRESRSLYGKLEANWPTKSLYRDIFPDRGTRAEGILFTPDALYANQEALLQQYPMPLNGMTPHMIRF